MKADDPLAKKDYITAKELSGLPLIMTKRQSIRNEIESWFRGYMNKLNIAASCNLSTNASILVEQGLGYALIIEGSMPFLDKSAVTYRFLYPERTATSVLAWKKHQPFGLAVTKFLEHIQYNLRMDNNEI